MSGYVGFVQMFIYSNQINVEWPNVQPPLFALGNLKDLTKGACTTCQFNILKNGHFDNGHNKVIAA